MKFLLCLSNFSFSLIYQLVFSFDQIHNKTYDNTIDNDIWEVFSKTVLLFFILNKEKYSFDHGARDELSIDFNDCNLLPEEAILFEK